MEEAINQSFDKQSAEPSLPAQTHAAMPQWRRHFCIWHWWSLAPRRFSPGDDPILVTSSPWIRAQNCATQKPIQLLLLLRRKSLRRRGWGRVPHLAFLGGDLQ